MDTGEFVDELMSANQAVTLAHHELFSEIGTVFLSKPKTPPPPESDNEGDKPDSDSPPDLTKQPQVRRRFAECGDRVRSKLNMSPMWLLSLSLPRPRSRLTERKSNFPTKSPKISRPKVLISQGRCPAPYSGWSLPLKVNFLYSQPADDLEINEDLKPDGSAAENNEKYDTNEDFKLDCEWFYDETYADFE